VLHRQPHLARAFEPAAAQSICISLANDEHIEQLLAFLSSPPYDKLLSLEPVVHGNA